MKPNLISQRTHKHSVRPLTCFNPVRGYKRSQLQKKSKQLSLVHTVTSARKRLSQSPHMICSLQQELASDAKNARLSPPSKVGPYMSHVKNITYTRESTEHSEMLLCRKLPRLIHVNNYGLENICENSI